jgi:cyanophycinase-like exopeptidase
MGSGENSPAMVTPHQKIIGGVGADHKRINLDTPYGFQENADELSAKIEKYFEVNVGKPISTVQHRNRNAQTTAEIESADWVFAGPGSPTYALKTWSQTGADKAILKVLERGSVVMASAAAMSLGVKVIPVYEIYKVGEDPHWLDGLNILEAATGIRAVVVAHYNNNQGGTHDTRFCFVGGKRMAILEEMLDPEISILGIDEHTGIAFNLETNTAEIIGKGLVTLKKSGTERKFISKDAVPISDFKI